MVSIENEIFKVVICPDLGGKVFSIYFKKENKEVLYNNGTVKPVRILPRMAFLSGGIEVSFPISHSPVQIEPVHYEVKKIDNRLYVWCGEQEVRNGLNWTVEFSLGDKDEFLTQRTVLFNPTNRTCSWMAWSNAAVPASEDSQLHFPSGEVLVHGKNLEIMSWDDKSPHTAKDFSTMTGLFWNSSNYHSFGVYTPSKKVGLYHTGKKTEVPGIKLWTYGIGEDEKWAHQTALAKESYIEIQSGPIKDQSITNELNPGKKRIYHDFWIPSLEPIDLKDIKLPTINLVSVEEIPIFGFVKQRKSINPWDLLLESFKSNDPTLIPIPPNPLENIWPPSGMENLDLSLRWAMDQKSGEDKEIWQYYLGVLYAAYEDYDTAIRILQDTSLDMAYVVSARIYFRIKNNPEKALNVINRISAPAIMLHPQIVEERDLILSSFGETSLEERGNWLDMVSALKDDRLIERRIAYHLDKQDVTSAKQLFNEGKFSLVHQRYSRTELWKKLQKLLGVTDIKEIPAKLGEDELAAFGKYRVNDQ
jgi:hypothetical protein